MSDDQAPLGPTGQFAEGRIRADDQGQIQIAIQADTRIHKVIIDFGVSCTWMAFSPPQARALAQVLMDKADVADGVVN